jgi:hypothetical protein
MRVGDVPLHPADLDFGIETAAPSDLDRFAEAFRVGWLADQAMIWPLASLFHPLQHLARAIDGNTFFVAGNEQADRAVDLSPASLGIIRCGSNEAGNGALHIAGAPAVETAVRDLRGEGRMGPELLIARGHDIGMPGKAEMRRPVANAGEQIMDWGRVLVLEG